MRNRAAAIIQRDDRVLFMRRQKPGQEYYILPGGGVKLDESFSDACKREVIEETGLEVLGLTLVLTNFTPGKEEQYFLVRVGEGEPVLGGPEAEVNTTGNSYAFVWLSEEELQSRNLKPEAAKRLCLSVLQKDAKS